MSNLTEILGQSKLFCDLPEDVIEQKLIPAGTIRSCHHEEYIITAQSQVDFVGVVISGKVLVQQMFSDGINSLISTLKPGYILGADLICTNTRRSPYFATAVEPSDVFLIPANVILEPGVLNQRELMDVWHKLMTFVSHENMRKHYRIAILSHKKMRDRILVYLTMQASRRGTSTFEIPFSRDELAEFLCVNRSALSHELSKMEQEGLIRFRKNKFTLLDQGHERSVWKTF